MVIPIRRRDFLRQAAALGVAVPFVGTAAAAEAELVARKIFFDNPDIGSVRISPDGEMLSWLAPIDNVRNLFVAPRDDLNAARAVTHATDRNLSAFYRWAHTSRHLVFFPGARRRRKLACLQRRSHQRRHRAAYSGARREGVLAGIRPQIPRRDAVQSQRARQALPRPVPDQPRHR